MAQVLAFGRSAMILYSTDDIGKKDRFCATEFVDDLKEL